MKIARVIMFLLVLLFIKISTGTDNNTQKALVALIEKEVGILAELNENIDTIQRLLSPSYKQHKEELIVCCKENGDYIESLVKTASDATIAGAFVGIGSCLCMFAAAACFLAGPATMGASVAFGVGFAEAGSCLAVVGIATEVGVFIAKDTVIKNCEKTIAKCIEKTIDTDSLLCEAINEMNETQKKLENVAWDYGHFMDYFWTSVNVIYGPTALVYNAHCWKVSSKLLQSGTITKLAAKNVIFARTSKLASYVGKIGTKCTGCLNLFFIGLEVKSIIDAVNERRDQKMARKFWKCAKETKNALDTCKKIEDECLQKREEITCEIQKKKAMLKQLADEQLIRDIKKRIVLLYVKQVVCFFGMVGTGTVLFLVKNMFMLFWHVFWRVFSYFLIPEWQFGFPRPQFMKKESAFYWIIFFVPMYFGSQQIFNNVTKLQDHPWVVNLIHFIYQNFMDDITVTFSYTVGFILFILLVRFLHIQFRGYGNFFDFN